MNQPEADLKLSELRQARASGQTILTVHYACESWFEVRDRPVAISCISFYNASTGEEVPFSTIDNEAGEKFVLERYYDFLRRNSDAIVVNWNMNSADFSFLMLDTRYTYLSRNSPPYTHPRSRLCDLDELFTGLFGEDYAEHPKLHKLACANDLSIRGKLSGAEEAEKFKNGEHSEIRRSTAVKAKIIGLLLDRLLSGKLETKLSGPRVDFAGSWIDSVRLIAAIGERFSEVSRQMQKRHGVGRTTLTVNDEYDAQDLFHSLLRLFFDDVRKEEWTPSYAGSASRMDFLLPAYKIALELKHTRQSLSTKDLGDELIVDVSHYRTHGSVRSLVCLVFDEKRYVDNPRGLERDLSNIHEDMVVTVRILDR
ncbi:MAG: hypothetical protein AABN34_26070 [Acidobacteriota bacterium]